MSTNEQKYRTLDPNEVIQEGDEGRRRRRHGWVQCGEASIGTTPNKWPNHEFRRPIPAEPEPKRDWLLELSLPTEVDTAIRILYKHHAGDYASQVISMIKSLRAQLTTVTEERDRFKAALRKISCMYCGRQWSIDDPTSSKLLADHILSCDKSPLVNLLMNLTVGLTPLMETLNRVAGDPETGWHGSIRIDDKFIEALTLAREAVKGNEVPALVELRAQLADAEPKGKALSLSLSGDPDKLAAERAVNKAIVADLKEKLAESEKKRAEANQNAEDNAKDWCELSDALGQRGKAFEEPMERIRDLIAAEGELGDVKAERDQLRTRAETAERERDEARATIESIRMVVVKLDGSCSTSRIIEEVEHVILAWNKRAADAIAERDRLQAELAKCREAFDSIREILVSSKLQVENQKALTTGTHALLDSLKKQIREISQVAFERAASIKAALEGGK